MDSFGTVLMAYVLGPVCGCMVGVAGNILYTIFFGTPLLYALTSAAIGVAVGVCAKKGFMNSMFGVMSTAFVMTIFSAVISVPVNYILYQGGVGNIWGDSVSKYLQELGFNMLLCNIAAVFAYCIKYFFLHNQSPFSIFYIIHHMMAVPDICYCHH